MKFITKNWKIIITIIILLVIIFRAYQRFGTEKPEIAAVKIQEVEVFDLFSKNLEPLILSCQAEPVVNVSVTPQSSGTVSNVLVNDGEQVTKNQLLFELDNIQQRVALQDARIALDSALLQLQDLEGENNLDLQSSLLAQTKKQQDIIVNQARNNLFNTDLRAYPIDDPEEIAQTAPQVIGNYTCENRGQYIIEVYSSASDSGASYRYSGLESGTSTVSTTSFGTRIGDCGLELVFPEDFKRNEDWIISIPNTNSSEYFAANSAYEQALENRNIALNQTETSFEEISQQQGRVTQARLRYELAIDNLEKTRVRAMADGALNNFGIDQGDFVNSFSELGTIKTIDRLELVAFVSNNDRQYISPGTSVTIEGIETEVLMVNAGIDSITKQSRMVIAVPEDLSVNEGDQFDCSLVREISLIEQRDDGGVIVPLSSLSIIGTDSYVFTISQDMKAQALAVTTGALLGTDVVVYGIETGRIIKDARGIRPNEAIRLGKEN